MSEIYKCDVCGRFDFVSDELKTIVTLNHQEENDFIAKFNYKTDVLVSDVCPVCMDKIIEKINELKGESK